MTETVKQIASQPGEAITNKPGYGRLDLAVELKKTMVLKLEDQMNDLVGKLKPFGSLTDKKLSLRAGNLLAGFTITYSRGLDPNLANYRQKHRVLLAAAAKTELYQINCQRDVFKRIGDSCSKIFNEIDEEKPGFNERHNEYIELLQGFYNFQYKNPEMPTLAEAREFVRKIKDLKKSLKQPNPAG